MRWIGVMVLALGLMSNVAVAKLPKGLAGIKLRTKQSTALSSLKASGFRVLKATKTACGKSIVAKKAGSYRLKVETYKGRVKRVEQIYWGLTYYDRYAPAPKMGGGVQGLATYLKRARRKYGRPVGVGATRLEGFYVKQALRRAGLRRVQVMVTGFALETIFVFGRRRTSFVIAVKNDVFCRGGKSCFRVKSFGLTDKRAEARYKRCERRAKKRRAKKRSKGTPLP